jgi:hypothetical protein
MVKSFVSCIVDKISFLVSLTRFSFVSVTKGVVVSCESKQQPVALRLLIR